MAIDPFSDNPPEENTGNPNPIDFMANQQAQARQAGVHTETANAGAPEGQPDGSQSAVEQQSVAATTDAQPSFNLPEGLDVQAIPEHMDAETAYNMARYWQSEASKAANELKSAKQQGAPQADVAELARQLQQAQQQQQAVAQSTTPQVQQAPEAAPEPPVVPQIPDEPYGDEWDDYIKDVHAYNQELAEYQTKLQTHMQQNLEQKIKGIEEYTNSMREQQEMREAVTEVSARFGMNQQDAEKFVRDLASGQLFQDVDLLAKAYIMNNNSSATSVPDSGLDNLRSQVAERNAQAQQQRLPMTPAAQGVPQGQVSKPGLFTATSSKALDPWG
jgi:hypothetical protein